MNISKKVTKKNKENLSLIKDLHNKLKQVKKDFLKELLSKTSLSMEEFVTLDFDSAFNFFRDNFNKVKAFKTSEIGKIIVDEFQFEYHNYGEFYLQKYTIKNFLDLDSFNSDWYSSFDEYLYEFEEELKFRK